MHGSNNNLRIEQDRVKQSSLVWNKCHSSDAMLLKWWSNNGTGDFEMGDNEITCQCLSNYMFIQVIMLMIMDLVGWYNEYHSSVGIRLKQ